jgi:succinate dehydrogenase flavin-adding protein (antitoxin of CptAB toxin-antitoxin module)
MAGETQLLFFGCDNVWIEIMQSIDDLSETAQIAYQAFLDLRDSKTAHFDCLEAIENIYESGGAPSEAENRELEQLLTQHDKNVMAFKTAIAAVTDASEKETLVKLMS